MAQPTTYDRQANFSNEETLNPTGKTPGTSLDAEFNAIKITSDETLSNLALIQRDDGALANGSVGLDQLAASLSIGFTLRGPWAAATNYVRGDGASYDSTIWRAVTSHLSVLASPPSDSNVLWEKLFDFVALAPITIPDGSVSTAKLADGAVTNTKLGNGSVSTSKLADSNVTTAKLADSNVTTAKLADSNVTTAKLADGSVTAVKLAAVAEDRSQAGYRVTNLGDATADTDALNRQTGDARYRAVGQCRLTKVSANLVLAPWNGNILVINGNAEVIPDAGVSLAPTGLTPSTLYYVYAYMSGATMTLEASTTAPATQAGTGVRIKTGDATRTLVGMVRPITGPAFADTAAQRFVKSWFNPLPTAGSANFTTGRSVSAGTYAEANTEIRNEFLTWAGEVVEAKFAGSWQSSSGVAANYLAIAFDGTKSGGVLQSSTATLLPASLATSEALTEGYHYATIVGKVSASNVTLSGGSDGGYLHTVTRG